MDEPTCLLIHVSSKEWLYYRNIDNFDDDAFRIQWIIVVFFCRYRNRNEVWQ